WRRSRHGAHAKIDNTARTIPFEHAWVACRRWKLVNNGTSATPHANVVSWFGRRRGRPSTGGAITRRTDQATSLHTGVWRCLSCDRIRCRDCGDSDRADETDEDLF